ncbi:MAG: SUMF1/EgtB/PvdO family nonheme iron enzyme [Pseudomonadota bacterium]
MTPTLGRRFFLGIGVPEAGGMFSALPEVAADLERMRSVFVSRLGYEHVALPENPDAQELRAALNRWLVQTQLGPADRVVFYYSGHGYVAGGSHYLCTRGFRAEVFAEGLRTSDLAGLVLGRDARPGKLFLIVDCCFASRAAGRTLVAQALERNDCYLLAASAEGPAYDGLFSRAFATVVDAEGAPSSLDELAAALKSHVGHRQSLRHLGVGEGRFDFLDGASPGAVPLASSGRAVSAPAIPAAASPALSTAASAPLPARRAVKRRVVGIALAALIGLSGVAFWIARGPRAAAESSAPPVTSAVALRAASAPSVPSALAAEESSNASVVIPSAVLRLGVNHADAAALYEQCRSIPGEGCGSSFADSVFARSVSPDQERLVPAFAIDVHEVTNQSFAQFLDGLSRRVNCKEWHSSGVLVCDASGNALAAAATGQDPESPYGIELNAAHVAPLPGQALRAANYLTWRAADAYCRAHEQRLPSEWEWEVAARGLEGRRYPWGDTAPDCRGVAFAGEGGACPPARTAPANVGSSTLDRTPQNVRDLGGNVLEWTGSAFEPVTKGDRVRCAGEPCAIARGGSFLDHFVWLHAALRSRFKHNALEDNLGFRCAKDVPGSSSAQ